MAHNNGDASKAYRLRKAKERGQVLKPIDALWLSDYDATHGPKPDVTNGRPTVNGTKHFGASREGRKIKFELQEQKEAAATGSSEAAMMAAAALQERAAGERLDALTVNAMNVYAKSVDSWERLGNMCRRMLRQYQKDHLETLRTVRHHYLENTSLKAQLADAIKAKEDDDDPVNQLVLMSAAKLLGIEIPGMDPQLLEAATKAATTKTAKPKS